MTRFSLRLALCALSLAVPVSAFAVAPASVSGVKAVLANGKVSVSWNPSKEADVTSYRVYFSRASILENGGSYDDFEPTTGKETTYTLKSTPAGNTIFVAVTAVNSKGEESEYLGDETQVSLGNGSVTASVGEGGGEVSSSTKTSSATTAQPLKVLSARALSATGVIILFSENVRIASTDGPRAFVIKTASGDILPLTRLVVDGKTVVVDTLIQTRGMTYTIEVGTVVFGATNSSSIDLNKRTTTFAGHPSGVAPKPKTSTSSATSMFVPEVSNINLRAQPQANGTYTVTVDWRPGIDATDIGGFALKQTRDGGKTFSQEQKLPASATSARFSGVPSGSFGIFIKTMSKTGLTSKGALGTMTLPKLDPIEEGNTTVPRPVKDTPTPSRLPNSGPGTIFACILAGAGVGLLEVRRRLKLLEA